MAERSTGRRALACARGSQIACGIARRCVAAALSRCSGLPGRRASAASDLRCVALGALVWIAQLTGASSARAEPELSLAWTAPDACPDAAWAQQRIAAQLAREPALSVAHGVRASVAIEPRAAGFALSLHTAAGAAIGERKIEAERCAELAEAAALIIALSVSEANERGAPRDTPPPPAPPAPTPTPAPQPHVRQRSALFALRADAFLDVGFLDPLGFGPSFAAAYQSGVWRAELAALWIVPRTVDADDALAGSAKASLWALRAGGCALFGRSRVAGGPCAGGEFGQSRGKGAGDLAAIRSGHQPWIAGYLGGRASVGLIAKLALVAEADLSIALLRPGFVSAASGKDPNPVHTPALAQLRANAGVELRF